MAKYAHKLVSTAGEKVSRSGKVIHCNLAVSGDRVWELREGTVTGNVLYTVNAALTSILHMDLNLGFKTALYVKVDSGTTGSFNLIYD
jgi:hypothetical protein